jgi:hypothetical protein
LANDGTASFTGVTVNFTSNQASGGAGGLGGAGGFGSGGAGGAGVRGGNGGDGLGGNAGNGGGGGNGLGGAIFNANTAALTIAPRLGAKKGSKQSNASDTITANQAILGAGGRGGLGGGASAGNGGAPNGSAGTASTGTAGLGAVSGVGDGGGLTRFLGGSVTIDSTNITGDNASTAGNEVFEASQL